ncbi:MAG TPA: BF3164 family lipoprotein [Chitinophagaceae bacterium]|nr:BF3164 family lipoprotein [Chitinophagaceae bacterium]
MKNLFLLLFLVIGCKEKSGEGEIEFYNGEKQFTNNQFSISSIKAVNIPLYSVTDTTDIRAIDFIGDNTIIVDAKNRIFIINKQYRKIAEFGTLASDSLKLISARNIIIKSQNEFLVHDLTKNILHPFKYDREINKWVVEKPIELIKDLHGLISFDTLPNSTLIATSVNSDKGKVIKFTIDSSQKIGGFIGKIPEIKKQISFVTCMEYRSSCIYDNNTNTIFLAHFYTDLIEAYDLKGVLKFKIHGPDNFKPVYKLGYQHGQQIFLNTKKTKTAYIALAADNKYLYTLYSGNEMKNSKASKTIYIFTKDGQPFKKIELVQDIYNIKIDKMNNRLYGFKTGENKLEQLFYFDLSKL